MIPFHRFKYNFLKKYIVICWNNQVSAILNYKKVLTFLRKVLPCPSGSLQTLRAILLVMVGLKLRIFSHHCVYT